MEYKPAMQTDWHSPTLVYENKLETKPDFVRDAALRRLANSAARCPFL